MYFVYLVLGILGALFMGLFSVIFTVLYIDLNPSSTIPFACPQSKLNILRLLLKFILPLYATIDFKGSLGKEFIAILTVFYFFLLAQRYRTPSLYNKNIFSFYISCDATILWVTICSFISAFIDTGARDNIGLFYMIIGIPMFILIFSTLLGYRSKVYLRMTSKSFKKDNDVEMYVNILIDLVE